MSALAEVQTLADAAGAQLGAAGAFSAPAAAPVLKPAQNVLSAGIQTARITGDGSATTVVLARAILVRALKHIADGGDAEALKAELLEGVKTVEAALKEQRRPLTELKDIEAMIVAVSRATPPYARAVSMAVKRVGYKGSVSYGPPNVHGDTTIDYLPGLRIERGWASPWFATDGDLFETVLDEPYILVVDGKVETGASLAPILTKVAKTDRALLVLAAEFGQDALTMLTVNRLIGAGRVSAARGPSFGRQCTAWLTDLAAIAGAKVLTVDALPGATLADLGEATQVRQDRDRTALIGKEEARSRAQKRGGAILREIGESAKGPHRQVQSEIDHQHDRLAAVQQGVAVIRVGADDDPGPDGRADALAASRALNEEGVVIGAGGALVAAKAALAGVAGPGARILEAALEEPCRWIARNAGVDDDAVVRAAETARSGFGFNAGTGAFEDIRSAGIVDLLETTRLAFAVAVGEATRQMTDPDLIAAARAALPRIGLPAPARPPRALEIVAGAVLDAAAEAASPDVSLVLVKTGDRNVSVMRKIMDLNAGMGISAAKTLTETTPQTIKTGLRPREAEKLRDQFTDLGAVTEIR